MTRPGSTLRPRSMAASAARAHILASAFVLKPDLLMDSMPLSPDLNPVAGAVLDDRCHGALPCRGANPGAVRVHPSCICDRITLHQTAQFAFRALRFLTS